MGSGAGYLCIVLLALTSLACGCDSGEAQERPPIDALLSIATDLSDVGVPDSHTVDVGIDPDMSRPDPAFTPPTELPAVDELIKGFLDDNTALEGVAVIVVHRDYGVVHRRAYGAFDEDRVYFVASSSKMVAAGMINRLHDDGVFDMYAPIANIVDWGETHPLITPVQLISNSSGLPGLLSETAYRGHVCQFRPD